MNKEIILGQEYFGIDLTKDTADEAIFNGVCVQKTISASGRVSVALRKRTESRVQKIKDKIFGKAKFPDFIQ